MTQGYCVKCKAKKEMKDAKQVTMKNGRHAMKGKCPTCGTGMYSILGKKGGSRKSRGSRKSKGSRRSRKSRGSRRSRR